ncbi:hypothetical protein HEP87_60560 [Streptomyces sp. S1D4-11]
MNVPRARPLGQDADDLDVEEALALVKDPRGASDPRHGHGTPAVPAPTSEGENGTHAPA